MKKYIYTLFLAGFLVTACNTNSEQDEQYKKESIQLDSIQTEIEGAMDELEGIDHELNEIDSLLKEI